MDLATGACGTFALRIIHKLAAFRLRGFPRRIHAGAATGRIHAPAEEDSFAFGRGGFHPRQMLRCPHRELSGEGLGEA